MTEERSCLNCGYYKADRCVRPSGCCFHHSKWQPISKPKVQMTEEEFKQVLHECVAYSGELDIDLSVQEAKQKGYIRKSELVKLVEEAEWIYENYQSAKHCLTTGEALGKNYQAIQALKKDHPEFGGKK